MEHMFLFANQFVDRGACTVGTIRNYVHISHNTYNFLESTINILSQYNAYHQL